MDSSLNELGNFRFKPNGSKGPLLIMGNGHRTCEEESEYKNCKQNISTNTKSDG